MRMRKNLLIAVTIFLTFLLQTTIYSVLPEAAATPNLLLILTVSMGLMRGKKAGMWTGFFCGLLTDLFYGNYFGLTMLSLMYIGYICGFFYKVFFNEDIRIPLLAVSAADLVFNLIHLLVSTLAGDSAGPVEALVHIILPEVAATAAAAIVFYWVCFLVIRRVVNIELEDEQSPWLRR